MSKYRTPLKVEFDEPRPDAASRTAKYRLPFKKDDPPVDRVYSLARSNEAFLITSQVRLPKLNHTSLSSLDPDGNLLIPEDSSNNRKNGNNLHQSLRQKLSTREQKREQINQSQINVQQTQQSGREQKRSKNLSLSRMDGMQHKIPGRNHRMYMSVSGRYDAIEPQEQFTQTSEPESKIQGLKILPLPKIREKRQKKSQNKERDEEGFNQVQQLGAWQELVKQIQEIKGKRQSIGRKKLSKPERKHSQRRTQVKSNEIAQIQIQMTEYKKRIKLEEQKRLEDIYENCSDIAPQANQKEQKPSYSPGKQEVTQPAYNTILARLRGVLSGQGGGRGQKNSKQKLPLEFYLSVYRQIRDVNPFFRKVTQLGGCILLRMGKLLVVENGRYLYYEGDTSRDLYIIVHGKLLLADKHKTMKKFALSGETLAEYDLFEGQKSYIQRLNEPERVQLHRQDAKTLNKCCLLKIPKRKYYKMAKELNKMGYKGIFNLIDNLFRINYINKLANLHNFKRERIHTENLSHKKPSRKKGFFH